MRHAMLKRSANRLPRILNDYIPFEGGLDQVSPPFSVPPGRLRRSRNWEIGFNGGYSLIEGYQALDGRTKPSDGVYSIMQVTITGSLEVNDVVTGVTSSATGTIIAIADDSSYIVLTAITGTFQASETLNVSGSPEATSVTGAVQDSASSIQLHWQYKNLTADYYRALIGAVPGTGSILGVCLLNDVYYAFRNNAGGTAVDLYKSSTSGWTQVALGYELAFTSGGTTEITEGQTITGATSGATAVLTRVMLESGSWSAGDAAGKFVFASQTGTFQSENIDVGASANLATIAGDSSAITLSTGGRFDFYKYDFGDGNRIYGCDGVNRGFEFDGSVFCPISTGMTTDTPNHVWAHKNHLFFSFDGSLQHSGIKQPYSWSVITGAAELRIGQTINGFSTEGGSETNGALAIYANNSIHILYGTSSSDWNLVKLKEDVGARAFSIQQANKTFFLDDRGISSLMSVQEFGNFKSGTISELIQPFINDKKPLINASCVVREKGQIRYFFSDGFALYITFRGNKMQGMMPVYFTDTVECTWSDELSNGAETIIFGSDDGYVYELDKGTSFNGDNIASFLITHFHHTKTPRLAKDYVDYTLEAQGTGYGSLTTSYELGYADASVPQPATSNLITEFAEVVWDENMTWDNFFWDARTLAPLNRELEGTAENISFVIRTDSDYFPPIKLSGIYYRYRPRYQLRHSL